MQVLNGHTSDEVDGLLPVPSLWHPMVIEAITELVKKCHQYGKPAAIYTPNSVDKTIAYRSKYEVPLFESPEEAVRALAISNLQYKYQLMKEELSRRVYYQTRLSQSGNAYGGYAESA